MNKDSVSALSKSILLAVERLAADECVAFPTETVWGLAAVSTSERAVSRLRAWKGRKDHQPISLLVPDLAILRQTGFSPSAEACRLMDRFWPGPLTLVLSCGRTFADGIAREDGAVGLRCSSHSWAAAFSRGAAEAGLGLLTATSLNRSGDPPAESESEARRLCERDETGPYVPSVSEFVSEGGTPSTVLDLSGSRPKILRVGAISAETLYSFLPEIDFDRGEKEE
ncbi:MAG: hypothetical protein CL917_15225 [Deltaproteobacteria bacterium]|nr:hypothetical protein [Deltaproteobacteria bacterium]